VVVINAKHATLDGARWEEDKIRYHTGYGGGFKEIPLIEAWKSTPELVVKRAIRRRLPKNVLRTIRLTKLRIFPDHVHPFASNAALVHEDMGRTGEQILEEVRGEEGEVYMIQLGAWG
jgi:large subunit ribosomal protein L13